MKRIIAVSAILFFTLGFSPLASALSVGPLDPVGHLKWAVSAEDSYTFSRDTETTTTLTTSETKDVNQAYGRITLGLTDYFNVYAKLGATTGSKYHFIDSGTTIDYETDAAFLWGVGASGTYKFAETWKLIGDVQYLSWDSDVDKATYAGTAATGITNPGVENKEFQFTGLLAKDFNLAQSVITPYIGAAWVIFKTETESTISYTAGSTAVSNSWSLNGDDEVSGILGIKAKLFNNWLAFVEGRLGAEEAVSAGLNYSF